MLACFVCGSSLVNVDEASENQPSGGTEFRTYGHYGSTFWDSFAGEEVVLNVCDECLRARTDRIARHKRYVPLVVRSSSGDLEYTTVVGRQWVQREMVPYFDGPEDEDDVHIDVEDVGTMLSYPQIEWVSNWREMKQTLVRERAGENGKTCMHTRHVAECLDCGARPLEGLR
jgi:hypothetical protein